MSRTAPLFLALMVLASGTTSCGKDSPTAPRVDPNAGRHEITVTVHHFKIRGACEGVSGNAGEFWYELRVLDPRTADTLWVSLDRLTGLAGATVQPTDHTFTFIMDPVKGRTFEFEPRCTEYDNGLADSRMNERGTTKTHTYSGGTNWDSGLKIIQLGDTECGYEVQYDVSVRVL